MKKAIFLDKDGTLIRNIANNINPEYIWLMPGVPYALTLFREMGYMLVVTSNQSGVAKGYFPIKSLTMVTKRIQSLLADFDTKIDKFYFCPHDPDGSVKQYTLNCLCRKPMPGLLLKAKEEMGIDLAKSWMLGDVVTDIEAGNQAGCRTILVNPITKPDLETKNNTTPFYIVKDLREAAEIIMLSDINYQSRERRWGND